MLSRQTLGYLRDATVLPDLQVSTIEEAIEELLAALAKRPEVVDPSGLRTAVFARQQLDPPLMSTGIAIPHARTDSVTALILGVGILTAPVPLESTPIRVVFLIGVPKTAVAAYLELASFLARHLRTAATVDRLSGAKDVKELLATFAEPQP